MTQNRKLSLVYVVACTVVLISGCSTQNSVVSPKHSLSASLPISVTGGNIQGAVSDSNPRIIAFKGIPYAAPPVGELRWRPPEPVVPWEGVRDASEPGSICVQHGPPPPTGTQAEDCLFLNIWAPTETSEALPVMFWIHGGGYSFGSGSRATYDGTPLAAGGAIVVTMNYRLNVFGFFAHPALSAESPHHASGNYGLMDIVEALRWVQSNIASFGGDPDRVTIFGESAGAGAVMSVMLIPEAKGLFHGAVAESTWINGWDRPLSEPARGWEPAELQGKTIAETLGAINDPLTDLRAKTADELIGVLDQPSNDDGLEAWERQAVHAWAPNVDGWIIPSDPFEMYRNGKQHDVPLITGMNGNEGSLFTPGLNSDQEGFEKHVREVYGEVSEHLLEHYLVSSPETAAIGLDHLFHDMYFAGPVRAHANSQARLTSPVWLYHFNHAPPTGMGQLFGSHHAAEVGYVFGTLTTQDQASDGELNPEAGNFTNADMHLSETIRAYWIQFATTGNPNREGLQDWPAFTPDTDTHLELNTTISTGTSLHATGSQLWHNFELSLRD